MVAFQDTREHTAQPVMVHLLTEIEGNPSFTQRGLAGELGSMADITQLVALGTGLQVQVAAKSKAWPKEVPEKGLFLPHALSGNEVAA